MIEEEEDEKGMDTTYVGIMLVVFLALAALVINVGYLYVSDDDLRSAAETSALTGAQTMKQQLLGQLLATPGTLPPLIEDMVQAAARSAAVKTATGKHPEAALMHAANDDGNRLTTTNDITVGFWDNARRTYTPGKTPVNAIQVRTRRTAESDEVGFGNLGSILAKASGLQQAGYTPEAIAALPPRANVNFALCSAVCESNCAFPNVCTIPERKMRREPAQPGAAAANDRYAYTSLLYQQTESMKLSDMICMGMPAQEVCGQQVLTLLDRDDSALRDMESMMYNPNFDQSNKEYDEAGKLVGWWVIAPVTDCSAPAVEGRFERRTVTKYALVRISRICASGPAGCQQNNTAFDAPATVCGGESGLFIDRISWAACGSKEMLSFPGLQPVLVENPAPPK